MTASLEQQMREDRLMRDEALALVKTDYTHLKADYSNKGISARASDKVKHSANDIYGEAVEMASAHRGMVAAIVAAVVVWFVRHPIGSLLFNSRDKDD